MVIRGDGSKKIMIDGNQYGWAPTSVPLVDARMTAEMVKRGQGATEKQLHAASPAIAQR